MIMYLIINYIVDYLSQLFVDSLPHTAGITGYQGAQFDPDMIIDQCRVVDERSMTTMFECYIRSN